MNIDNKSVVDIGLGNNAVVRITDNNGVVLWEREEPQPITKATPMFFENVDTAPVTLSIKCVSTPETSRKITLETSTNKFNWELWGTPTTTALIKTIPVGERLYIRATTNRGFFNKDDGSYRPLINDYHHFSSSGKVNVGGNIMSLAYNVFNTKTTVSYSNCFDSVFRDMVNLVDASKLIIPVIGGPMYCFAHCFIGCTSLVTPPNFNTIETIKQGGFQYCFDGCTSLQTPPEFSNLTGVGPNGLYGCFRNCASLTETPILKSTKLYNSSYGMCFSGCTSLTKVTTYADDISAVDCLKDWLANVSPTGMFYNLGGATYTIGDSGIPDGWTEITTTE